MSCDVYVVHVMVVPEQSVGCYHCGRAIRNVGGEVSDEIGEQLRGIAEVVYEGYEHVEEGIYTRDFAVQVHGNLLEKVRFSGEFVWARRVTTDEGGDEIFDSSFSMLILRPTEIVEVATDFGNEVFQGRHGSAVGDAEMELHNAAFERLLSELGNDYESCFSRPYPDLLAQVIVDALRRRNLLTATRAEMTALSGEIIAAFEARK